MSEIDLGADAGELFTALRGVLDLHTLILYSPDADDGFCEECTRPYPCKTVQTIADAVFSDV